MNDTSTARASERGFTLVELMVVVAIIALLATIIVPNYVHARAQAAVSESEANVNAIATALELYKTNNPLTTYPAGAGIVISPALFNLPGNTANPFLTTTPKNSTNVPYLYTHVAAGAGGAPESYLITDQGVYDPTTLTSLLTLGGTTNCTACVGIRYAPEHGLYGV